VPVTITRNAKQANLPVEVTGVVPALTGVPAQPQVPGPFSFRPASVAAGTTTASFTITPTALAPAGRSVDLIVQGKATVNNVATTVTGPAVPVTVLNPFAVEPTTPSLVGTGGQTVTLKGKLKRQDVFKEAVTVTVSNLPSGVTLVAAPKPVAANQSDFQVDLRVDPKAPAAMKNLTVRFSTTIAGMAYSHPPLVVPLKITAAK
jgi:hypothetical protein